jgi:hypothetical protein
MEIATPSRLPGRSRDCPREDPFPSVVLDALAHGLPIVAFEDSGGFTELVRESGGLLAPYLDTNDISTKICTFIEDPERHSIVGQAGRQMIAERLTTDLTYFGVRLQLCLRYLSSYQTIITPNILRSDCIVFGHKRTRSSKSLYSMTRQQMEASRKLPNYRSNTAAQFPLFTTPRTRDRPRASGLLA